VKSVEALSELRQRYAVLQQVDEGLSCWSQGEVLPAVPNSVLQVLSTHQNEITPLWLDKSAATLKTHLLAFRRPVSRLGKLSDRVIALRARIGSLDEASFEVELNKARKGTRFGRNPRRGHIQTADIDALAYISEAAFRVFGFYPHREQLIGAIAILEGSISEMATGEGKTLTANLSAIAAAWRGMPVHVLTANDYLAARDCELGQTLFARCGVSAASVTGETAPEARSVGYRHDIVYTTARDMLADHLRDDLALAGKAGRVLHSMRPARNNGIVDTSQITMLGVYQVIVDEADSVLIDEAVTPLIISAPKPDDLLEQAAQKAVELARALDETTDYQSNPEFRSVELTRAGRARVAEMALDAGPFWQRRDRAEEMVGTALYAMHMMVEDKHFVIEEGKIVLIDELTGRLARQRTLSLGMQQVLEAVLDLEISDPSEVRARLSFQRYFRKLPRIGGMTGTAREAKSEFGKVYGLGIVKVPTHQPSKRKDLWYRVFETVEEKMLALVREARILSGQGRALLIGVKSVQTSDMLASYFANSAGDLPVEILNATNNARESDIVAQAGVAGAVTVATNMAGRGTDIKIDDAVRSTGGLHVIIGETNDFSRIDRQLLGRCARQGDPGSYVRFVALDEDVVTRFLPKWLRRVWLRLLRMHFANQTVARVMLFLAQRRAERLSYKQRKSALENEIDMEKRMI
jgi:preprotein translocase subunit SecA